MNESDGELLAGAAAVTITPPLGARLAGGFQPRTSTGVEGELTARALVLRTGSTTVALVTCDLVALPADMVNRARELIRARTSIAPSHVMVSATHTHSGPYVADRVGVKRDEGYVEEVATKIAESVAVALSRIQPATVAIGTSAVTGVCFNRRYAMADGTVVTNPGKHNPDIVGPAGPIDPTVTAMLVETPAGKPIALWANLSLHYVGALSSTHISPDYYGHFRRIAQRWLGDGAVALLSNGASGDINNVDVHETVPNSGAERAQQVATAVAAAAISAPMTARRDASPPLSAMTTSITAERWAVTDSDVELAQRILAASDDEAPSTTGFSFVTGSPIYPHAVTLYAEAALLMRDMPQQQAAELSLIRIGDLALVGLPGEVFVEFGLDIRRRSTSPFTAVVGLCGGSVGYLPTRKAFAEGGYETWRRPASWTAVGTGEAMVEEACRCLPGLVG